MDANTTATKTTTWDRLTARRMATPQGKADAAIAIAQLELLDGMIAQLTARIDAKKATADWMGVEDFAAQRRSLVEAYTTAWTMAGRRYDDLPETLHGVSIER